MNTKSAVEAALFSSSEPIRLQDIADRINVPVEEVRYAAKDLMAEYEERDSAITIIKIGSEYRMKLRDEYTDFAGEFMRLELTKGMMKTARRRSRAGRESPTIKTTVKTNTRSTSKIRRPISTR